MFFILFSILLFDIFYYSANPHNIRLIFTKKCTSQYAVLKIIFIILWGQCFRIEILLRDYILFSLKLLFYNIFVFFFFWTFVNDGIFC